MEPDDGETEIDTASSISDDVQTPASPVDISEPALPVDAVDEDALLEAAIAQVSAMKAKRAAVEAAVAASKATPPTACDEAAAGSSGKVVQDADRAAAMETKRAEVEAAVAEAKRKEVVAAVAAALAARKGEKLDSAELDCSSSEDKRKATAKDLFGGPDPERKAAEVAKALAAHDKVKSYHLQGNYGATKFIKP